MAKQYLVQIAVNFRKGISVANKTKINIINGFLSFYKTKDGLPKIKIVVMDFDTENKDSNQDSEITAEDDLPF